MAGDSLTRARALLTRFVDNKMGAGDRVAIISTSGEIGFLQQLTDNKAVLREAISRIRAKSDPESTASHVNISEVDANMVANHSDRGLFHLSGRRNHARVSNEESHRGGYDGEESRAAKSTHRRR